MENNKQDSYVKLISLKSSIHKIKNIINLHVLRTYL